MGKGIFWRYMQYPYTHCLRRAGASIQILPWQTTPESISAAVNQCSGFLFPGGPDIRPALYGQSAQPGCGISNPARDDFEITLLRSAIEAQKPLF